jgi:hypothetical protein
MHTWLHAVLSTILRRHRDEAGVEAIVIALVIFLLILILSGRRVLVQ